MNRKSFFDKYITNSTPSMLPSGYDRNKLLRNEDNILLADDVWVEIEKLNPGKNAIAIDLEYPKFSRLFRALFWRKLSAIAMDLNLIKEGEVLTEFEDSEAIESIGEFSALLKDTSKWTKPY